MEKRLCKSRTDKKIAGVCGGIGNYFDVDPTVVRIIWAICILGYGIGLFAYIIAAFVLPEEPLNESDNSNKKGFETDKKDIEIEEAEKVED
mgnify:FL=1